MLRAYLDTNVYDHIDKGYVGSAEIEAFYKAVRRGELVVHLSIANVEELLGQWATDRPAALRKLKIAREFAGFDEILKQPSDLLGDAYRAYAAGDPVPSPSMLRAQRDVIVSSLHRIVGGDRRLEPVMSEALDKVRESKERFCRNMQRSCIEVRAQWATFVANVGGNATFEGYWAACGTGFAEDLAPPDCVNACRERGIAGLLQVRTVRVFVGTLMSLIFSQIVGDGSQARQPRLGDFYDLLHAIVGSVTDRFVTCDARFAGLLERVPMDDWRVVTSLSALLGELH